MIKSIGCMKFCYIFETFVLMNIINKKITLTNSPEPFKPLNFWGLGPKIAASHFFNYHYNKVFSL